MTRIIIHGCSGAMGKVVAEMASQDGEIEVVAGVDRFNDGKCDFPVYASVGECDREADVVVDFSNAGAVDGLLADCVDKKLPLILCTTGLSEEQLEKVGAASETIPILRSGNMSLGINLLLKLLQLAFRRLFRRVFRRLWLLLLLFLFLFALLQRVKRQKQVPYPQRYLSIVSEDKNPDAGGKQQYKKQQNPAHNP